MTLEELRATTIYKKNTALYDTVIDTYKGISKDKEGFKIYFINRSNLTIPHTKNLNFTTIN